MTSPTAVPVAAAGRDGAVADLPSSAGKDARRRRRGWADHLSSVLLAIGATVAILATASVVLGQLRFLTIDSGSMRSSLNPGDVAVLRPESVDSLQIGQTIAFHPPTDHSLLVIHRVVALTNAADGVVIQTKGDANNANDSWNARVTGDTVWYQTARLPALGYLVVWLQLRAVRYAIVAAVVLLILWLGLSMVWSGDGDGRRRKAPATP